MIILTQIAQKCEILLSPIFGSCLAAYVSQKRSTTSLFPLFPSFPLLLCFPSMVFQHCFLVLSLAGVGTVGVGVGVDASAGAGVGVGAGW